MLHRRRNPRKEKLSFTRALLEPGSDQKQNAGDRQGNERADARPTTQTKKKVDAPERDYRWRMHQERYRRDDSGRGVPAPRDQPDRQKQQRHGEGARVRFDLERE